jgi:hypothetical protein
MCKLHEATTKLTFQEESVMRITGRMLLRLEESIKIPEAAVKNKDSLITFSRLEKQ